MSVKQIIVSNRQIWKDDTSKEPVKFYSIEEEPAADAPSCITIARLRSKFYSIEEEPAADRKKLNAAAYNFELKKQGKI